MSDAGAPRTPAGGGRRASAEPPTPAALDVEDAIDEAGGSIPFARFMELALGHPEHGYYARAGLGWGSRGDYESSPEVHPVFGLLWAGQIAECWDLLGCPDRFDLIEVGAGSGALAVSVLHALREHHADCFAALRPVLLDGFPRRVEEQRAALAQRGLPARHALLDEWLAEPEAITGVIYSNEFFDALPVHLIGRAASDDAEPEALIEWHVRRRPDGGLALEPGAPSTPELSHHLDRLGLGPAAGCRQELSLAATAVARSLSRRLGRGYVLTLDYGYESAELYAPWRRDGTLMAFRDHIPQPDPLARPGLADLTAHVDLGALARAFEDEGLAAAATVPQATALIALGLGEAVAAARSQMTGDVAAYARLRRSAEVLVDPAGLGRVRVLVAARRAPLASLRCLRAVPTSS